MHHKRRLSCTPILEGEAGAQLYTPGECAALVRGQKQSARCTCVSLLSMLLPAFLFEIARYFEPDAYTSLSVQCSVLQLSTAVRSLASWFSISI